MKIALYLGSFNPFHNGHLHVVKTALNDFKMNGVIIVPSMQNPWKKEKVLDIDKRIDIILEYVKKFSLNFFYRVDLDLIEKELIPPYYSYATLHALKNKYCNDEVFILVGEDIIEKIPNWMHGEKIIQDYDFLIVDRSKDSTSSTKIREAVKRGEDISQYVNKNVINLIKKYYE